ncbi:p-aminobenzoyl-glutamate transport protein [Gottschalkia purinilytica]|uniref:p-aminobenzoyl-glutamate transport protein n=1 Tax=Gottschalkia purinilytica TaxID=1503 RepID=A0A0L0WCY9_GOTPU|nr:AbgT family transporter [Gottschalkia purinilytica]KNF09280.1 p-aminobenzoyl-glutamate transport protein [Gottschalkia purinilytica]
MDKAKVQKSKSKFGKFLDMIEVVGNKLPTPAVLFILFSLLIMIVSHICYKLGVTVTYEGINRETSQIENITVSAVSLLTADGIRYIFLNAVNNFTSFAPLGTVLVAMLGVGVAEETGFISALLRKMVTSTPKRLITYVVVFLGIMSNIASDAGYVVLVPIGAVIFLSFGRHPLAGLAAAFAGVSGGFSANLLVGPTDTLLAGLSTEAAKILNHSYVVNPASNWIFMIVSTFVITFLGAIVTEKVIEPRLGEYKGSASIETTELNDKEKRGLKFSLIGFIGFLVVLGFLIVPENAILRNPETGSLIKNSPFMDSIVFIIMLLFTSVGVFYGIGSSTVKGEKDVINCMSKTMGTMGSYLVLVFFASQFIQYFSYTNLGTILAVKGATALEAINFKGIPLIISFVILTAFINLFMGSASAKWAIMAPVFIPMFMQLGYSPEFTQLAYRIGDSTTNIISPLMNYFAVIVAFAQKYDEESGIGTLISTMLPYSMTFLIGWTILLIIWMLLKLPIGTLSTSIEYVVSLGQSIL